MLRSMSFVLRSACLVALIALTACTSEMKRAQKYFDDGAWDEAMASYEKVLARHPDNEDARIGLNATRAKWLDHKLIEVRQSRLAGNQAQSLETLRQIFENEGEWKMLPKGAAIFTQSEESEYAARTASEQITRSLKDGRTLGAVDYSKKYAPFFQAGRGDVLAGLETNVRTQGKQDCRKMTTGIGEKDFYYGKFTQKFCEFFGAKVPDLHSQTKREVQNLYHDIDVSFDDESNLSASNRQRVIDLLSSEFRASPWYDPQGKKILEISATGTFSAKHDVHATWLTHEYEVRVPYQETYTRQKQQTSGSTGSSDGWTKAAAGLEAASFVAGLASGDLAGSTSKHQNSDGTETVTETKYRMEPRTYSYMADEHVQELEFHFTADANLDGQDIRVVHDKSEHHTSIENPTAMPSIGLRSKSADLIDAASWLSKDLSTTPFDLQAKARDVWRSHFCSSSMSDLDLTPDRVFRCLKSAPQNVALGVDAPVDIQKWFTNKLGTSPARAEELIGRF